MSPALTALPPKLEHLRYLDGLRALAALFVVLHHAWLQIPVPDTHIWGVDALLSVLYFGHYAVGLFIVLSGFCLMLPIVRGDGTLKGGALLFLKKRAHRLLPPYYFALALSLLLIFTCIGQKTGTHWDVSLPATWRGILMHLLLVQDATRYGVEDNHAFWSISVEWRIYFLFPLLLVLWRRQGGVRATVITVICSDLLLLGLKYAAHRFLTFQYIGLFSMGMLAAGIAFSADAGLAALRHRVSWPLLTGSTFLIIVLLSRFPERFSQVQIDYGVGLCSLSLLVWASQGTAAGNERPNAVFRFLSWKPLAFLGTFAYSIYLIHAPLLQVFWQYAFAPLQHTPLAMFAALSLVGTPLIVALSYLFFLVAEKPFLNRRKPALP